MRLECKESKIKILLLKNILVKYKINEEAQYGVGSTTNCITKGLFRHEPAERGIKEIDECYDLVFWQVNQL